MGSNKYVGYVGGVAVAVGVGAAIAAASQGVASAETGKSDSSSASDSAKSDAGPKKSATGNTKRVKPTAKPNDKPSSAAASAASSVVSKATSAKTTAAQFEAAQVDKLKGLFTGHAAPRPAAATPSTTAETTAAVTAVATPTFSWNWNPFRWMPPEPAPQDMPGPIWTLEESFMAIFPNLVKPVAREGFEFGYRLTQMIPWVNIIVPVTNVISNLPDAFAGDKAAAQRVINNLIVTIQPVAVLYYGYNEVADFLNLEEPALQLQTWFISSLWNLFDPFALLHNRGDAGLPLSTSTPPPDQVTPEAEATTLAAAVTPKASEVASTSDVPETSDPFRPDDPEPYGMPAALYNIEKALLAIFPTDVRPFARELYEASWRISQMVPAAGAAIPIVELLPALYQAAIGHKDTAQTAINNVLLATTALSILYYGFDEIADLANLEAEGQALKAEIYAQVWDEVDPQGYLHVPGHSGLTTV